MKTCLVLTVMICMVGVLQVEGSCETFSDTYLVYNGEEDRMEVICLLEDFILKLGESRETSDCNVCTCHDGGAQCCRIDQHRGAMSVPEECEVVDDPATGPCAYKIVRKDNDDVEC